MINFLKINDASAKTIFFRRQAEKSLVFLQKKLQKPTFCRIVINSIIEKNIYFQFYFEIGSTFFHLVIQNIISYRQSLRYIWFFIIFLGINCTKNSTANQSYVPLVILANSIVSSPKEIYVDGLIRTYKSYIPLELPEKPSLLLVYHGSNSDSDSFRKIVGPLLEKKADQSKFIILYLDGYKRHFNDCRKNAKYSANLENINDVGFSTAVVRQTGIEIGKDIKSVYALGYSNGGQMVYRLTLESPDFLEGAVVISANLPILENFDCKMSDTKPKYSIAILQGTLDTINPLSGGEVITPSLQSRGKVYSSYESLEWFNKKLGFDSSMVRVNDFYKDTYHSKTFSYHSGSLGSSLILLDGGGHTVPQENYTFPETLGQTFRDNKILENALDFVNLK